MVIRKTKGVETLLVIHAQKAPTEYIMKERWKEKELQRKIQSAMVFVRNKNLHNFERGVKGAIMWIPYLEKIVVVIWANELKAFVQQVYPRTAKINQFKISMLLEGFYLEQIWGPMIVKEFYSEKRIHQDKKGGLDVIVPLTDEEGFITMNKKGPDVAVVGAGTNILAEVPTEIKVWLQEEPLTFQKTTPLEHPLHLSKKECQPTTVAVIYVYPHKSLDPGKPIVNEEGVQMIGVPLGKLKYSSGKR